MNIDLPLITKGKVRDVYGVGEDRLLMVTSDRISAFDVVLNEPVPHKGAVLNLMSAFWFDYFYNTALNHMVTVDPALMPLSPADAAELRGRAMLCRKAEMLPIECIVRGRITGSGWKDYQKNGQICGHRLPEGLQESQELPEPIFTPSTKHEEHDRNVDAEEAISFIAEAFPGRSAKQLFNRAELMSLELFRKGAALAARSGIIIADTKFEFGLIDGQLALCDEVLTPDSSRFWPADQVVLGQTPPSFDKQPVRDYLDSLGWNKKPPPPELPDEVVMATSQRYIEAYQRITGQTFPLSG